MGESRMQPTSGLNDSVLSGDMAATLSAAISGDSGAFEALTEPYRRELLTHCYRILGSPQDAEDLVQETLLRAWRRLKTYEGRAPFRAWLYKIATNACFDVLAGRPRRSLPPALFPPADSRTSIPAPISEPIWLEPFPDEFLAPPDSTPEARFEARESISLSFLAALQTLPPRQRCVLILSDVLDWHAAELADMLGTSISSVNSLLHRARTNIKKAYPAKHSDVLPATAIDPMTSALLDRYMHAWESANVDEIISLLIEDTTFAMPPVPFWLQGKGAIQGFISTTLLEGEARGRWYLRPIRANGGPGFAWYRKDDADQSYQAYAIQLLSIEGGRVTEITTFVDRSLFRLFKMPLKVSIGAERLHKT